MTKLRVLVVEDSLTVRKRLLEVLSADSEIDVIAEAEDGKQAIELCREHRPDVVTMDMMLPIMSGLAATEYIMAYCPTPILVVSASTNRGELFKTYDALAAGAIDVFDKPRGDGADPDWETKFLSRVKLVARVRAITHPRARLAAFERPNSRPAPVAPIPSVARTPRQVVALGASTGGPSAIVGILRALPSDFALPILLVLHISEPFSAALADWLNGQVELDVANARDGETLASAAGRVVMAPAGRHLTVQGGRLRLSLEAERHSCRPSVDVLFESVAREIGSSSVACLLTGMGRDGASGLLAIRNSGGLTIAQDEATCVVYGMPREAILLGAAEQVLPVGEIGPALAALPSRECLSRQA